ncbi:hypothetical protein M2451_000353 [Dysgonomonas sp. PFB1-18]|uniref:hypothetical protein n=1 Tax=unclassified Dysgonomonas TaxID=2630389 RepID=UPI0024766475|nr:MULTISPECIES: hypothetical protein [unclassified Dysgonomonas]MDH6307904.1 hypothetical protein [Dysgonomonas sp. PF1-14]MDH6337822.1 hypothetical protein [Dysgonomonas sp. PF1-16]MDH6379046.1 hypothetical protein [Dysgonomonas sp. PFB1-18]MDH6396681.1 hypothetical protein [Dysgonomonas sp. PF1-23]
MKKIIYLFAVIVLFFVACGGDDKESSVMIWTGTNQLSEVELYEGSAAGGIKKDYSDIENQDSLQTALVRRFFSGSYNSQLFKGMYVDFNEDKVTFVDSISSRKIVSNYEFDGDSLFAIKTDGGRRFIGVGNMDSLYRVKTFSRYASPKTGKDTVGIYDGEPTLEKLLNDAGYENLGAMTNKTDTLIWFSAKYIFK